MRIDMLDRRTLLIAGGSSLAMLGAHVRVAAQRAPVTRRSVRGMPANDPDLAAMRRAVAAMKALPPSDPRNWTRFAEIHADFCPHGNWYFLPWHRAYILSFERICQELSGKPDFALPYWDWTVDREFPRAFSESNRANPLFDPRPGVARGLALADDMVGPRVISRIMNSPDFEAFGSTRPRGQNSTSPRWQQRAGSRTELEFNPHDGVHQSLGGNMAIIPWASRDPIFYLHHANVDRLWTAWNRRGNANSAERMWRDFAFTRQFVREGGRRWDVGVGELGSPAALGYRYDDDDGPFAADVTLPMGDAVTERLRAYRQYGGDVLCGRGGQGEIPLRAGGAIRLSAAESRQIAYRERPVAIPVPLGRPLGELVSSAAMAFRPDRPETMRDRRYVFAVIHGVEPPPDATTRVRVFCNNQALSPRTRLDDPSYATSFSFFVGHGGRGARGAHAAAHGEGASICVDLTPSLARMEHPQSLRSDRLTVQLLPTCDNRKTELTAVRTRCVEVVIL
jgi:tyrosinase